MIHSLISIVVFLIVGGLIWWLIQKLPLDPLIKQIITVVMILILILVLLRFLGFSNI